MVGVGWKPGSIGADVPSSVVRNWFVPGFISTGTPCFTACRNPANSEHKGATVIVIGIEGVAPVLYFSGHTGITANEKLEWFIAESNGRALM